MDSMLLIITVSAAMVMNFLPMVMVGIALVMATVAMLAMVACPMGAHTDWHHTDNLRHRCRCRLWSHMDHLPLHTRSKPPLRPHPQMDRCLHQHHHSRLLWHRLRQLDSMRRTRSS